jgi:uncharacterized protein (TIGR03086 family)
VDIIDMLGRALDQTGTIVDGVPPEQMDLPAVGEWSVRTVIAHLTRGNENTAAAARGEPRNPDPIADVGGDPAGAYRRSAAAVKAAWHDPAQLRAEYPSPFGPIPGQALLTLRMADNLTHGWDVAHATGQKPSYDEDIVQTAMDFAQTRLAGNRGPGGAFGPPVSVSADLPTIDRLAAFLGRTP